MEPRRLNSQVQLQSPPTGTDAEGQPSGAWAVVATLWADIRHVSGLEAIKGGAEVSTVKASIRIRWRDGVTPAHRIVWGSTVYEIRAVLHDTKKGWTDLVCEVVS